MDDPCRIEKVELFEDRAAITRVFQLEGGRQRIHIGPVSALVHASRLSTPRLAGDADWVLEDVRIRQQRLRKDEVDDAKLAELRELVESHQATVDRLIDDRQRVAASHKRATHALSVAQTASAAALQEGEDPAAWVEALQGLAQRAEEAAVEAAQLKHQHMQESRELSRLQESLVSAQRGQRRDVAWISLQVHARSAGSARIRTIVPCALWRPVHRATLEGDEVHWEVRAACWNATGEDWTDAQLVCSTARPGQHADSPELTDDRVRTTRRSTEIVVEAREEQVEHAGVQGLGIQKSPTLPGVDDGGEARVYELPERVDIPADGRPIFLNLESFSSPASTDWRAIPMLGTQAVLRSTQTNLGIRPLLAGPVELVRNGMSVGSTSLKFVSIGERFELGWGSHDSVRVVRKQEHEVERAAVTGTQTHTFEVEVRVSHVGTTPLVLRLDERIPVSELKQVDVELQDASPQFTSAPDEDGLCGWRVQLEPGSTRTFTMSYVVSASRSIVLPF